LEIDVNNRSCDIVLSVLGHRQV